MRDEEVESQVIEILGRNLEAKLSPEDDVIRSGLLDSLTFVDLMLRLQEVFGVQIDLDEVELDDFRTARSISGFLIRRRGAA